MPINSTEMTGFIAALPAALTAGVAAYVSGWGRQMNRNCWINISVINTLITIELFANMRHRADRIVSQWLKAVGIYIERRPAQVAAIALAILIIFVFTKRVINRAPTYRLAVGYGATALFATLFVVESISLHQIDAIFYRKTGPILLIGWLWLACGITATVAALLEVWSRLKSR